MTPSLLRRPFDAVLFDMDGVLVDAAPIHRRAFAEAVRHVTGKALDPSEEALLEGRPTKTKLEMLGIAGPAAAEVFAHKQKTTRAAAKDYPYDGARADDLAALRRAGLVTGVVTNSITETACAFLHSAGLLLGSYVTAADAATAPRPKPAPDLYREAARCASAHPTRCLVFEDTLIGAEAARAAGCVVWPTTFVTLPSHLDCLLRLL